MNYRYVLYVALFGAFETCLLIGILVLFSKPDILASFSINNAGLWTLELKLLFSLSAIIGLFGVRLVYNKMITSYVANTQKITEQIIFSKYVYSMRSGTEVSQSQLIKYTLTDVIDYVHMYLQPILAISLATGAVLPIYVYFLTIDLSIALLVTFFIAFICLLYKLYLHPLTVKYGAILRDLKQGKVHVLNDFIINNKTAFFYNFHREYKKEFDKYTSKHAKFYSKLTYLSFSIRPTLEFVSFILIAVAFYYVSSGKSINDPSEFLAVLGILLRVLPAGASLITNISYIGYASAPRRAINNALKTFNSDQYRFDTLEDTPHQLPKVFNIKSLECKFIQASSITKIEGLKISKGQKIAITGDSGAGKSTFINALMGFHVDAKLTIQINELSSEVEIMKGVYPSNVGYVPQSTALITGTLRQNICLDAKFDADQYAKIMKICQIADLASENPTITSTNPRLSGGEQQRLALARALYVEPEYLILDEGLSALPTVTQRQILNDIHNSYPNIGIVAILHGEEILDMFDTTVKI